MLATIYSYSVSLRTCSPRGVWNHQLTMIGLASGCNHDVVIITNKVGPSNCN
jgi:hypothetical protein